MRFGRLLRFIRNQLGLNTKQMANLLKVRTETITQIEANKKNMGYKVLKRLSQATLVPMTLLIAQESILLLGGVPDFGQICEAIKDRLKYTNELEQGKEIQ